MPDRISLYENLEDNIKPSYAEFQRLYAQEWEGTDGCLYDSLKEKDKLKPVMISCGCDKCSPFSGRAERI